MTVSGEATELRGIDTNLLVRYFTADDPAQFPLVRDFFYDLEIQREGGFITSVALCELVWTLERGRYAFERSSITELIEGILESRVFLLESHDAVRNALVLYRDGKAGFSDYLVGEIGRLAGCSDTVTFDRKLSLHEGFTLLASDLYPTGGPPTHFVHEPE